MIGRARYLPTKVSYSPTKTNCWVYFSKVSPK